GDALKPGHLQPQYARLQFPVETSPFGNGEFRRCGRGRSSMICSKIDQRDVSFVSDRGDDRDARGCGGPDDALVVKRPQFLIGTSAPTDDHYVDIIPRIEALDRSYDAGGTRFSLDDRGCQDDVDARMPSPEDSDDIPDGGPGR